MQRSEMGVRWRAVRPGTYYNYLLSIFPVMLAAMHLIAHATILKRNGIHTDSRCRHSLDSRYWDQISYGSSTINTEPTAFMVVTKPTGCFAMRTAIIIPLPKIPLRHI